LGLDDAGFNAFCDGVIREWVEWGATLKVPAHRGVDFARIPALAGARNATNATSVARTAAAPAVATGESGRKTPTGLRILAVDDDPVSLKLLERHLVIAGHQVACAADGNMALQQALETNPQVVIADWMMPEMNGLELCRALRRIESGRDIFF